MVKERLNPDAIFSDGFRCIDGSKLLVYYAFSNQGCRDLLDRYGLEGKFSPVLLVGDSIVLDSVEEILVFLGRLGASRI